MRVVLECAREVPPLLEALSAGDQETVNATKERIFEREHAADEIKNELRIHLPKSLFMPGAYHASFRCGFRSLS
jgi:uncharacterized protein Yka (UPF0111/DUF47 family)